MHHPRFDEQLLTQTHVDVASSMERDWLESKSPGNAAADWKKFFCACEFMYLCEEPETGEGALKRGPQKHYGVVLTFVGDKATEFAIAIKQSITSATDLASVLNKGLESTGDGARTCTDGTRLSSMAEVVTLTTTRAELRIGVLNNTRRFTEILTNMDTSAEHVAAMVLEQHKPRRFLHLNLDEAIATPLDDVFYHRAVVYHRSARDDEYDGGDDGGDDDDGGGDDGDGGYAKATRKQSERARSATFNNQLKARMKAAKKAAKKP
jgi:hypothetical protein